MTDKRVSVEFNANEKPLVQAAQRAGNAIDALKGKIKGGEGLGSFMSKLSPSAQLQMRQQLGVSTRTPPVIPPPIIPKGINWGQAGLGAATGVFSPFMGARLLSASGLFGRGGGGNGGGAGGLFGQGGASGYGEAFLALQAAIKTFEFSVKVFSESVHEGAHLYQQSGRLGKPISEVFSKEFMGKVSGLSASQIDQYMLRQNWGHSRRSLQNFGVGASLGGLNESLSKAQAFSDRIGKSWETISARLYTANFELEKFKANWSIFWAEFTQPFVQLFSMVSRVLNAIPWDKIGGVLGKFAFGQAAHAVGGPIGSLLNMLPDSIKDKLGGVTPNPQTFANGSLFQPQANQYNRMGFVMGGGDDPSTAAIKQTASNTQQIVTLLQQILIGFKSGAGAISPIFNLP